MLFSTESVLVVAQSSSEILEGLMNNPVLRMHGYTKVKFAVRYWKGRSGRACRVPVSKSVVLKTGYSGKFAVVLISPSSWRIWIFRPFNMKPLGFPKNVPKQMLRDDVISEKDVYVIHTSEKTQKIQIFICTFMCLLSSECPSRD